MHDDVMHEVVIQSDLNEEQEPHESFTVFLQLFLSCLIPSALNCRSLVEYYCI